MTRKSQSNKTWWHEGTEILGNNRDYEEEDLGEDEQIFPMVT